MLRELSLALHSFYKALRFFGLSSNVVSFTTSEFGHTMGNNGDGTDHAWGGHYMVMGDAVNGNNIYGKLPILTLAGEQDTGSKGRIIPTTSTEQYLATLCSWFGVDDALMPTIFPTLINHASDPNDIRTAYLTGLMK